MRQARYARCPVSGGPHFTYLLTSFYPARFTGSQKDDNKWRDHWMKSRDAASTLRMMPSFRRTSAEYQLLTGLDTVQPKTDLLQALLHVSVVIILKRRL